MFQRSGTTIKGRREIAADLCAVNSDDSSSFRNEHWEIVAATIFKISMLLATDNFNSSFDNLEFFHSYYLSPSLSLLPQ